MQFNVRGEDSHTTVIGGVFSFLGSILVLLLSVIVLFGFANGPEYNQTLLTNYFNFGKDTSETYTISLQESMPRIKLIDRHPAESAVQNISSYVMPYYIKSKVVNETTREFETTFFPAIDCKEVPLVREDPELAVFFKDNPLEPLPFWCPSVPSFEVENDPWLTQKGSQFSLVLHYCDVAAEALGLDGSGCETDHTKIGSYMNSMEVANRITS